MPVRTPSQSGRRGVAVAAFILTVSLAGIGSTGPAAVASDSSLTTAAIDPGNRVHEFKLPNPLSLPTDVAAGADGSVWVSTFGDRHALRIGPDGSVLATAPMGAASSLTSDGQGGVWAVLPTFNLIDHATAAGVVVEFSIPTRNSFPMEIFDGGSDFVFFTESNTGQIGRLTKSSGRIDEFTIAGAGTLSGISGTNGQIWVTDPETSTLWVLNEDGAVLGHSTQFPGLRHIEVVRNSLGSVEAIAASDTTAYRIILSGSKISGASEVSARTELSGIAQLGSNTWFVDTGTESLGRQRPGTAESAEYAAPTGSGATGLAVTEGRYIWSVGKKAGTVMRFDTYGLVPVDRVGGADRYEVAASLSAKYYAPGQVQTVFVVSGEKFADALSVGAYAARLKGPVLLTTQNSLPDATKGELLRLKPDRVVIVGGTASVSDSVTAAIGAATPATHVMRIGGADRYAVSRALLTSGLVTAPLQSLYVANGQNYPDALSSTPAAATRNGVVLLVNGQAASLDAGTLALIDEMVPSAVTVMIAGGPASVSPAIEAQIGAVAPTIRIGGADRFEVSKTLNAGAFPAASGVFLASGATFPDALSGGAVAGRFDQPVYLSRGDCLSTGLLDRFGAGGAQKVTLLGGPNTLSAQVENLQACG